MTATHDRGGKATQKRATAKVDPHETQSAPWPHACHLCRWTGRRTVAEHSLVDGVPSCTLHATACTCPRGRALTSRQDLPRYHDVRDSLTRRGRVAIVDPTPRQELPGGHDEAPIPAIGAYVPRNQGRLRALRTPVLPVEEARAALDRGRIWPGLSDEPVGNGCGAAVRDTSTGPPE